MRLLSKIAILAILAVLPGLLIVRASLKAAEDGASGPVANGWLMP